VSKAILTRLQRLEVKVRLGGTIHNISDDELAARIWSAVDSPGGIDLALESIQEMKRPDLETTLRLCECEGLLVR